MKKKKDFKTGDWVILNEDFILNNIGIEYFQKDFKNRYYRPRKIIKIKYDSGKYNSIKKEVFIEIDGKKTLIKWKNFRIATENEIRREKMKSIFHKKLE